MVDIHVFIIAATNLRIDLQSEHERYLTEKYAKQPIIVTNYPKAIKAFYMRVDDDGRTVAAMDVLAPGIGEIIGGSQRKERLEVLDRNMAEHGIDREHYAWYRDPRRYGTLPHAGLGFERTLACVTASPARATQSPSREPLETRSIGAYYSLSNGFPRDRGAGSCSNA